MTSILIYLSSLTFTKDVGPIFQKRCSACHNEYTPERNWLDYKTAFEKRFLIKKKVWVDRTMPLGGMYIEESERRMIKDWVDQGGKK